MRKVDYYSCSFRIWKRFSSFYLPSSHDHVTSFRSRRTRVWWFETLGFNQISVGEKVCIGGSARCQWRYVVSKDLWRQHKRKELSTAKLKIEFFYVIDELFKGTLVFHLSQNWWVVSLPLEIGRSTYFTEDFHGTFSLFWGHGLFRGGKEKDKARQAVFLTLTNPFGNDPEEEEPHDDYTVPQKVPYVTRWKHDQHAVNWIRLSEAQDRG